MTQSLIQKLRDATGGSRELDHELLISLGAHHEEDWCDEYYFDGMRFYGDNPTQSLDAIIGLIEEKLPGWRWAVSEGARATLQKGPAALSRGSIPLNEKHKSAPIALCLALLSALEGETHDQ
jgi:hypothetical protein